jgi:DnaA family protein
MKQIPLPIAFERVPSFDGFVPGANTAAMQHLRRLGRGSAALAPLYLWGPEGSGKTHLLQALVHERQLAGERVGWFNAADPVPWEVDEGWTLVVMDDCDRLDALHQQAAFAAFIDAATFQVQVVAAGRVPPVDLPVREDLRTRLGWGDVFALQPLTEREARATLQHEAQRRGIELTDDVMDYLLNHFDRDLKHLMTLLDRLDGFALAQRRAVTVPLLRRMLAEEGS